MSLPLIGGKDPSKIAKERLDDYAHDPERLLRDLRAAQQEFQTLYDALTGNVKEKWGPKEVKLPEKKKYVKYTQKYQSRAIVDFDRGQITVETVDEKNPQESLSRAVVMTLLTPQDPRVVDVFSDKEVPAEQQRRTLPARTCVGSTREDRCAHRQTPNPSPTYLLEKKTEHESH